MTGLFTLWLPILLSAVIVFIASSIIHMLLPWHRSDYPKVPNEDKVRDAGFDPARLPPGQYFTEKWPVLHYGPIPTFDGANWDLEVSGLVGEPFTLSFQELRALPTVTVDAGWSL